MRSRPGIRTPSPSYAASQLLFRQQQGEEGTLPIPPTNRLDITKGHSRTEEGNPQQEEGGKRRGGDHLQVY